MFENRTTQKLQLARLYEWIGDIESSERIYREIMLIASQDEKGIANLLISSVDKKLKELVDKQQKSEKFLDSGISFAAEVVKNKSDYQLEIQLSINPELEHLKKIDFKKLDIEYSVSQTILWGEELKLELRAFNPKRVMPRFREINIDVIPMELSLSNTNDVKSESLLEWEGDILLPKAQFYISIDKWGLIRGTIQGSKHNSGDLLVFVHLFLKELESLFEEE
ncbi:hypothetical protein [Paenibacillus gorillae]|uniref:hypothetical protein n=1 Tax=Paenibacillus gorillae TaxID=1243662 RepID=UPI0005A6C133|nr:hypothetical protein [Paenibacillus gorillae]